MADRCTYCDSQASDSIDGICAECGQVLDSDSDQSLNSAESGHVDICRKCAHRQPIGSIACHKCGLRFAYAKKLSADHRFDGLPDTPLANVLRDRWDVLKEHLHDREAHYKFIDLCSSSGQIQFAGHCYQQLIVAQKNEAQTKQLRQYQERVVKQATVALRVERTASPSEPRRYQLILLMLGALMILGFAYLYFRWSTTSTVLQNAM